MGASPVLCCGMGCRVKPAHFLLVMLFAAATPLLATRAPVAAADPAVPAWPHEFDGKPLVAVNLTDEERRWIGGFPGSVARFTDGERELLMRWVTQPTRRLHPAEDCYRGWGFQVSQSRVRADRDGSHWRCFTATKDGEAREVCEQIRDAEGGFFTDVSSWYWASSLGRNPGPWLAISVAERLPAPR
jgi:hypothetical protein